MSASNFKDEPLRDPKWLKQVAEMPCCLTGRVGPSDAAHIRYGCLSVGRKPADNLVLPISHDLHAHQHNVGEKAFWRDQMNRDDHFMMEAVKAYARELHRKECKSCPKK